MKDKSVAILNSRAASAGLSNCRGVTCLIEDYSEAFDVSVALHGASLPLSLRRTVTLFPRLHGASLCSIVQ